ncbi:hypothetical protein ACOME3_007580 [Neoechinorhynchus agilis]
MFSQPPSVAMENGIRQSNSLKIKVPPDIRRHLLSDRSEGDIRPPTKLQTSSSIGDTHKIIYFDRPVKKGDYVTKISVIPIASKEATWGCFLKPWLNTKKDSILRIRSTSFWNGTLKIVFVNNTEMDDFESFVKGRHDEKNFNIQSFRNKATFIAHNIGNLSSPDKIQDFEKQFHLKFKFFFKSRKTGKAIPVGIVETDMDQMETLCSRTFTKFKYRIKSRVTTMQHMPTVGTLESKLSQ